MAHTAIKEWRDICEIDYCPECGSPLLTNHNDSNIEAYAVCEDCGADTQLKFAEPYVQGIHGAMKDWADSREVAMKDWVGN